MMQKLTTYISLSALAMFMLACNSDKSKPGYTFMDDMYISPGLETYGKTDLTKNGLAAQLPVKGTVPRDYFVYEFDDTQEGYDLAKASLKMPVEFKTDEALADGKKLYTMFCNHCHGPKGDGNGHLVAIGKFPAVPDYKTRDINEGTIYHVMMYGKNLMGSHASQLNNDERWKIVRYVQDLRGDNVVEVAPADSTATAVVEINDQQS